MAHGGRRPGAGRPQGSMNKRSQEKAEAIEASGLTPLDYMISVFRDEQNPAETRLEAAKSAGPYVHAKLHATELITPSDDGPSEDLILSRIQEILQAHPDLQARFAVN